MKNLFFFFFIVNISFGLSFFDSVLYNITDYFKENIETNPNFKIYLPLIKNIIKDIESQKNRASLTAQKILILSILLKVFCANEEDISEEYIKKECYKSIKKICKKKRASDNYFSLLMIAEANDKIIKIKNYTDYCKKIAPHWFDKSPYFEDKVEYKGPNLKKSIDQLSFKFINENLFGPVYFIFIYALTQIAVDTIK
jgi:hypothetical protein